MGQICKETRNLAGYISAMEYQQCSIVATGTLEHFFSIMTRGRLRKIQGGHGSVETKNYERRERMCL